MACVKSTSTIFRCINTTEEICKKLHCIEGVIRRSLPYFGKTFLKLNYTATTKKTIQEGDWFGDNDEISLKNEKSYTVIHY
jgi:hypothetical protein